MFCSHNLSSSKALGQKRWVKKVIYRLMTEEQIGKLQFIKDKLKEGTYTILQKPQWDEFSRYLCDSGAVLLGNIEKKRDDVRKLKVPLGFFLDIKYLKKLDDATMRWLKAVTDGNQYEEYQILTRQYIAGLVEHCRQSLDYLGSLISAKRNEYYHYQALFFSVLAIVISAISLIIK